jgi:exonuclease VII small subunit
MGAYSLEEIMKRWQKGELTTEQAVGQILQVMQNVSQRLGNLERRLADRERDRGVPKL